MNGPLVLLAAIVVVFLCSWPRASRPARPELTEAEKEQLWANVRRAQRALRHAEERRALADQHPYLSPAHIESIIVARGRQPVER